MTKEKELQEFKERCLALNCGEDNFECEDCPLWNNSNCELTKFKRIVKEDLNLNQRYAQLVGRRNGERKYM